MPQRGKAPPIWHESGTPGQPAFAAGARTTPWACGGAGAKLRRMPDVRALLARDRFGAQAGAVVGGMGIAHGGAIFPGRPS
jgi:hypothetical protein